uniref:RING-type domain-containing protein n=1 Tax=Noctiluca scintillans TaxID=2966 RepID=A0A7S1AZC8_NOCSC|mmetsp:Transcript_66251/g.175505  ORF Transcript_66251/g.175505 Transcript_66251/m.175505 type:complete len:288 (+) Transcript_66251:36-899(+)
MWELTKATGALIVCAAVSFAVALGFVAFEIALLRTPVARRPVPRQNPCLNGKQQKMIASIGTLLTGSGLSCLMAGMGLCTPLSPLLICCIAWILALSSALCLRVGDWVLWISMPLALNVTSAVLWAESLPGSVADALLADGSILILQMLILVVAHRTLRLQISRTLHAPVVHTLPDPPVTLLRPSEMPVSAEFLEQHFPSTVTTTEPTCVVCLLQILESEPCRRLQCDHLYHTCCIDQWWMHKNDRVLDCPSCRQRQVLHMNVAEGPPEQPDVDSEDSMFEESVLEV